MLPAPLAAQITAEAKAAFPAECCGLIEGLGVDGIFEGCVLHPARNAATEADRFEIAPEDHFAAFRAARARGRRLIGCYHSHPDGQFRPSQYDGKGDDNVIWLIAATDGASAKLAAWLYRAGGFAPLALMEPLGADLVTSSLNERS
jgi:proteasome lid subunit RPN8/RPN11